METETRAPIHSKAFIGGTLDGWQLDACEAEPILKAILVCGGSGDEWALFYDPAQPTVGRMQEYHLVRNDPDGVLVYELSSQPEASQ